jgi:hypothetical protein
MAEPIDDVIRRLYKEAVARKEALGSTGTKPPLAEIVLELLADEKAGTIAALANHVTMGEDYSFESHMEQIASHIAYHGAALIDPDRENREIASLLFEVYRKGGKIALNDTTYLVKTMGSFDLHAGGKVTSYPLGAEGLRPALMHMVGKKS